jgi:hypothetical protein
MKRNKVRNIANIFCLMAVETITFLWKRFELPTFFFLHPIVWKPLILLNGIPIHVGLCLMTIWFPQYWIVKNKEPYFRSLEGFPFYSFPSVDRWLYGIRKRLEGKGAGVPKTMGPPLPSLPCQSLFLRGWINPPTTPPLSLSNRLLVHGGQTLPSIMPLNQLRYPLLPPYKAEGA